MIESAAALGPRLKAAREDRGLSTQKAADELHLDAWVVDALEADDYARIGPSVYVKGHLKRYAGLLALPVGEVLAGYESRAHAPPAAGAQAASVRLRATDAPAVRNLPLIPVAGSVAVALLVLGVLWWKPWQQRGAAPAGNAPLAAAPVAEALSAQTDATNPSTTVAAAATPATSATPLPPATLDVTSAARLSRTDSGAPTALRTSLTRPAATAAAAVAATATDAPGTGRARLRLSFSADSWVDVHDAAGRRLYAGNGSANSVKSIAGSAPMHVYLGFANGVQLDINGRTVAIGPQFVAGHVARFEAGADGVLRRDVRSVPARDGTTRDASTRDASSGDVSTRDGSTRNTRPPG
ncbi:MAG TPA: RodZ domain-containing protein [Steroidobacteraceae bacterium]